MNFRNLLMWGLIVLLSIGLFNLFQNPNKVDAQSNKIAFSLHWKSLAKQIRVRGVSEKEDGVIADDYYSSRDIGSRIGAWASRQSAVLKNRQELLQRVREVEKKFNNDPPRPSFWGGIRIRPLSIEFWTDGEFRLHERELWTRTKVDSAWSKCLLYP